MFSMWIHGGLFGWPILLSPKEKRSPYSSTLHKRTTTVKQHYLFLDGTTPLQVVRRNCEKKKTGSIF